MNTIGRLTASAGLALFYLSSAHAVSTFGAMATGNELFTPGQVVDGGAGSASAAISTSNFSASASFLPGSTYLPELSAYAINTTASNSDDRTGATAEAYQVFTSTIAQTVEIDVSLHGIIDDFGSETSSYLLADVFVFAGMDFRVSDSYECSPGVFNGFYVFDGTKFCGRQVDRTNLFISDPGEFTVQDLLSFDLAAGEMFAIYGILRANAKGGEADGSQTLSMNFRDAEFVTVETIPSAVPLPGATWLFGAGLLGVFGFARKAKSAGA
jgi:hypothetical protein